MKLNIRRELSKSYGDLSNLRPRSPPIQNLPARLHALHLSPGNYVDDTQNLLSPSYNRQARRAIPNDWVTVVSGNCHSTTTEKSVPTCQQMFHNSLYDTCVSRHMEAEPVKISILGLTSGYVQPRDLCIPLTRSHPGDEDQRRKALQVATGRDLAVEHIDISTVWNGLSGVDANELFRVHQAFVSTLEKMLANELWQIYQQLLQQDSAGTMSPTHTLFSTGIVRGISFCRDQLVSEMVETLYSSKENAAKARSGFLRLFLVTTDALVQHHEDSSRDTSITIRMRCDPQSPRPYPVVDAAWVPDFLMFEGLDESPLEGQCLSVVPKYCSKSAFRPNPFLKNIKYSIESEMRNSPLSWLVWDDEIAGFKGTVPFYSEVHGYDRSVANIGRKSCGRISHSLKIIVQAVLVDDNGSSLRYERILRARLTINVVPWYVNGNYREIKERLSVPKAYQDARLASAAQHFSPPDPTGNPCRLGQFPSGLPQWSKGAPPCMPTRYTYTDQVGIRDSDSAMSSSATGARMKETMLPDLARTQAHLMAQCARLTSELANVKEQIMMSMPIDKHTESTLHEPDPQESVYDTYSVPLHRQHQPTSQISSIPCTSRYASEELTTPLSPSLHGEQNTSQLGRIASFPALPPPAIGLRARPKLDLQAKDRDNLDAVRTSWKSTPAPGITSQSAGPEGLTPHETHLPQETDYHWRLPYQASISTNGTSGPPPSPQQNAEALSTPSLVGGELAGTSNLGTHGLTRQARPNVNRISPPKLSQEIGKQLKRATSAHTAESGRSMLTLLDSEDQGSRTPTQASGDIFFNSFGPLRSLRSSTALGSEDFPCSHASERGATTNSSRNFKHRNRDSGCSMLTENTDSDDLIYMRVPASSGFEVGATKMGGFLSTSYLPTRNGQARPCPSTSVSFSPRHFSTSSTDGSRSTSSDIEIIIEQDPRARGVSRQEQAKAWKLLSQPDKNWENQQRPEKKEVRLSEDEKKAMEEAMQRSLDELAEGFDDIFLEDTSESSSGSSDL